MVNRFFFFILRFVSAKFKTQLEFIIICGHSHHHHSRYFGYDLHRRSFMYCKQLSTFSPPYFSFAFRKYKFAVGRESVESLSERRTHTQYGRTMSSLRFLNKAFFVSSECFFFFFHFYCAVFTFLSTH